MGSQCCFEYNKQVHTIDTEGGGWYLDYLQLAAQEEHTSVIMVIQYD